MTHVLLAELAFQRQEELAARARDHHPSPHVPATAHTRRTRQQGPGMLIGRLADVMSRA